MQLLSSVSYTAQEHKTKAKFKASSSSDFTYTNLHQQHAQLFIITLPLFLATDAQSQH